MLVSEFPFRASNVSLGSTAPVDVQMPRNLTSNKFWARVKCGHSGKTISMMFGVHCYEN